MTQQLVNYNITDAAIREMREKYLKLRIVDLDDKDGAKAVSAARRAVKSKRCEVERRRKELKADALEWGRKVDSEAKRITEMLAPIERHLEDEEARIEQERARIKAEEEARAEAERRAEQERVLGRMTALAKFGGPTSEMRFEEIAHLSEMEFDDLLEEARARWEKAEAERKAEEQRLEQIRREQAAERERIAEERRVIEEEKQKLAEEKATREEKERRAMMAEALEVEAAKIRQVCEETKERIEEVREMVNEDMRKAATPPDEMPSVIEMINEFRDHEPEFLQDRPSEAPESAHERYQVSITGNTETIYCRDHEKLFSAIGQWIDEIACEGDTLSIMVFSMTDQQYADLLASVEADK